MSFDRTIKSQITFLYYKDLAEPQRFYGEIMGFELVEDQGWAKIYRIGGNAFVGLVDEAKGSRKVKEDSAVLLTLVVDDVPGWYEYLKSQGVKIVRELGQSDEIQVQYCFIEDPGGYMIEIERFLKPELANVFGHS
ncbi:MAG: VOC family protein [Chloroflexota bacterium]